MSQRQKRFVNIKAWQCLVLASSLQLLDFLAFVGLQARFAHASFLNHGLLDNLFIEMGKGLDLEVEERLDGPNICSPSLHRLADVSEHVPYARLCVLELVFNCLAIQIGQV
jgi:hypothetical protein